MKTAAGRLGAYALVILGVFATAFGVGSRFSEEKAHTDELADDHDHSSMQHTEHGGAVAGLGATVDDVTLEMVSTPVETPGELRMRFVDANRDVITEFAENHGAQVHMLVIRSDLSSFQHVHPTMDANGTWRVPLVLEVPGAYRVVTDVKPAGRDAAVSPSVDVVVAGLGPRVPVPAAADDVTTGDLRIVRREFTFTVSPSDDLEPYLGQPAHLVGFREGDLAYLHLHAESGAGGVYSFVDPPADATGTWRFFLQFGNDGDVVTQGFTVER